MESAVNALLILALTWSKWINQEIARVVQPIKQYAMEEQMWVLHLGIGGKVTDLQIFSLVFTNLRVLEWFLLKTIQKGLVQMATKELCARIVKKATLELENISVQNVLHLVG